MASDKEFLAALKIAILGRCTDRVYCQRDELGVAKSHRMRILKECSRLGGNCGKCFAAVYVTGFEYKKEPKQLRTETIKCSSCE